MTKEETENAIKVMQAYVDGKQIEFCTKRDKKWELCGDPLFNWSTFDYRISENPQYRPFQNSLECLQEMQKHHLRGWISYTDNYYNLIKIDNDGVTLSNCIFLTFKEAYEECIFLDI